MNSNDSVEVLIPEPLREYVGEQESLRADPGTVADIIVQLTEKYPRLGPQLVTEDAKIAQATVIAVDGHDIVAMEGLNTAVEGGQSVVIVTSLPV